MGNPNVSQKEDMFPLIENWQKSGLSQRAFCRQEGLALHVSLYWLKRYKENHPKEPAGFVPVQIGETPTISVFQIKIQYSNRVKILDETPIKVLTSQKPGVAHTEYFFSYYSHLLGSGFVDCRKGRDDKDPVEFLNDYKGTL
ncbi:MAG: hypothetical protein Q8862_05590 [Bacteroidota bacterium]|nr:hypothetical protein [Bacteroidota bacterium]